MLLADMPPRFQTKVVERDLGCWEWTAARSPKGYGRHSGSGPNAHAHRFAWTFANGPVPDGLVLDHFLFPARCIGPACANPAHVRPVTHQENSLRSDASVASRWASAKRCKAGHELTPENTGWYASRGRFCVACGPALSRME